MKKDKNKGKKLLTAVGAVVAGLTPGIMAASPVQGSNAAITAADMVAIDGNAYSFDELYAMQQHGSGLRVGKDPQHVTMYGVPRPVFPTPPQVKVSATLDTIQYGLMDYCVQLLDADPYTRGVFFTLDSDLTDEMGMSEDQLKELKAFIEEYYGVEVSHHRFRLKGQLNTLGLIAEYIYKLKTVWD